jgi:hypothetical protein
VWHLDNGYIFGAPDYFLMGYAHGDTWIISVAIGDKCLTKFAGLMPYYLPYVGWSRDPSGHGEIKQYPTKRLLMRVMQQEQQHQFGGAMPSPPKPPAPPSKDNAATNLLNQGTSKPPVGFDSTITGDNKPGASQKKTLLGE